MSRQKGLSRAYASVSVVAVFGLLAGCSQPASYATVDLGGSYGNGVPQAYSARSGLPVYRSTQVYTTPAAPQGVGQSQLVYLDAPTNQVASLSPGYSPYSAPLQQSYPVFDSVTQGATLTDETILRSDGYIDIGAYEGVQTAALSPGVGSIGFETMPVVNDALQYLPAPSPAPQAYEALPYSAPVLSEALPPPAPVIQEEFVGTDYAALVQPSFTPLPPQVAPAPVYEPIAIPAPVAPLDTLQAAPAQPAPDNAQAVADYYDIGTRTETMQPQQTALQLPEEPVPAPPAPVYAAPDGDIALPPASQAYPRPYEALPPGFFPTYEFPSGNDLVSEAPVSTPEPVQVAELVRQRPIGDVVTVNDSVVTSSTPEIEQASTVTFTGAQYTIQPGDTLYGIARIHGVTPLDIAKANGLPMAGTIYAGNTLTIPTGGRPDTLGDAPVVVLQTAEATPKPQQFVADAASINTYTTDLTDQSVEMIDIEELARMFRDRETGQAGAAMPVISAEAGNALRGRPDLTPTEVISEPMMMQNGPTVIMPMSEVMATQPVAYATPSYSWPVHGDVFRLEGGGLEIAVPAGQPVAAAAGGRVVHVQNGTRGVMVVIEHSDGWRSITLGLNNPLVQVGQTVTGGATLGFTDGRRITFELRDNASNVAEALGVLRS